MEQCVCLWVPDLLCVLHPLAVLVTKSDIIFILCGFDEPQLNTTLLDTIAHHTPAGTSARTVAHYGQEIHSEKFCAFDFGSKDANQKAYGSDTPPEYKPEKVTAPIAAFWGDNDWLAQPAVSQRIVCH